MGQKAHPYGLRVGYIKPWKAKWFGRTQQDIDQYLHQDLQLRKFLKDKMGYAGISNIEIERSRGRVRVRIFTARPGVIIGRRGQEIDKIREELSGITSDELFVDIKEVKSPQTDAQLVAENIALQLEKRVAFRRAMKKAVQVAMSRGALGIKVICKGRLGGADIARTEKYREGKVPLSTFRADVDYGFAEAHTTYGSIGCKAWVYKGDILVKKEEAEERRQREAELQELEQQLTKAKAMQRGRRSRGAKKETGEDQKAADQAAVAVETEPETKEEKSDS